MSLLSSDRTRWQEDTITQIRRNLRILPMNASGERLSAQETTRVVVMYGYPQVGKTTVLLQLCGIRDELSEELETLLRAGEPIGSSSTSTAILYERADREDFGLGSLKGETDWFESGQDFSDALRQVREEVEAQQRETGVLRICIPKRFYRPDASAAPIRILDLPGVDSRNKNEEQHVRALMESFLLSADLRIVVCKAANLQSLEDPLPFLPDNWLQLPSEYLVIATHAFSENTIRRKLESMQEGHFWLISGKPIPVF